MEYKIYKLRFLTDVHFGVNSLENCEISYRADTLFAALCQEAVKIDCLPEFYEMTKKGEIQFSDMLPYMGDTFYIPKPLYRVEAKEQGDSSVKKKFKKMKYIPIEELGNFINGEMNPDKNQIGDLGEAGMRTQAAVRTEGDTVPYHVATYSFRENNGLYVIIKIQNQKAQEMVENLFKMLSFTGIGGERNHGFGKFEYQEDELPKEFLIRLKSKGDFHTFLSLSLCLPREDEIERAMQQATYLLTKRSGIVDSKRYTPEQKPVKKSDFYAFAAGSCFTQPFQGDIYDVSIQGLHPVYRYAKPMFLGVK